MKKIFHADLLNEEISLRQRDARRDGFRPDVSVPTSIGNVRLPHADKKSLPDRRINTSRRRVCRIGT